MQSLSLQAVRAAMLVKLRSSLLTEQHAKTLRFQPMTEDLARQEGINPPWAGFQIPYFTPEGKLIPDFYRYRFWPDTKPSKGWASMAESSKLRYVQPKNTEAHIYLPPLLRNKITWREVMAHTEADVYITEGELKAACACANTKSIMLGLGGVFSWMSKRRQQALLPILEEFRWKERRVYICFDSDQNTKPLVQLAASRLALALTGKGAVVYEVRLPPLPDGAKQGVDDYIATQGVEAWEALVAGPTTQPVKASLELHRLNDEVAVVWGGDAPKGNIVRLEDGCVMNLTQFAKTLYRDRTYVEFTVTPSGQVGTPKLKYAAEEWLAWPMRTKIAGLTYRPGEARITDAGDYNLWRGGGVQARKGDLSPWNDLLGRMFKGADPLHLLWFKRWLAYPLAYPGTKLYSCVLLWSREGGTGKNLLAEAMMPLYGVENTTVIMSRQLTSDFNNWAERKQFIIGDEITLDDKKQTSGDLKSRLTSKMIHINRKGIESYEIPDCTNYYFTSNDPMALMLEPGERRTFVWHVNEEPLGDAYGKAFMRWVHGYNGPPWDAPATERSGAAAIANYLTKELDLGDFSPTAKPPETEARMELISNSRSDVESWAASLRLDPKSVLTPSSSEKFAARAHSAHSVYTPTDLIKLYDPEDRKRCSLRAMGLALEAAGFRKALHNNGRLNNVRSTFWLIQDDDYKRSPITSSQAAKLYIQERGLSFQEQRAADKEQRRKMQ